MRPFLRFVPAVLVAASVASCRGDMTLSQISIAAIVSSVTVDGEPADVVLERGDLPTETAAPVIEAQLPVAAINGGSFPIDVSSTEPFSQVIASIPGVPDYFRITLASPRTSASIVVTLDPGTRGGPLEVVIAAGNSPTEVGPYVSRSISVTRVGSGDVQVSVSWNSAADLDLHVLDPFGEEVYWGARTSESNGELDLDSNAACGTDQPRNENIVWPRGQAPAGTYVVRLDHWSNCDAVQTDYVVTVWVKGQDAKVFSGTFIGEGDNGGEGSGTEITTFTK